MLSKRSHSRRSCFNLVFVDNAVVAAENILDDDDMHGNATDRESGKKEPPHPRFPFLSARSTLFISIQQHYGVLHRSISMSTSTALPICQHQCICHTRCCEIASTILPVFTVSLPPNPREPRTAHINYPQIGISWLH